jgi:hypothetical protein
MNVAEISLEGNMPSLFYGNGTNCWIFYGSWSKSYICSYLIVVLKTMAPSWAISNTPIDQTFVFSWEKLIVLDQTQEIWISPFVSDFVVIISSAILLLIEDQYYLSLQYPLVYSVTTPLWPSVGVKPNTWKSWRLGVFQDSRMFIAQ